MQIVYSFYKSYYVPESTLTINLFKSNFGSVEFRILLNVTERLNRMGLSGYSTG